MVYKIINLKCFGNHDFHHGLSDSEFYQDDRVFRLLKASVLSKYFELLNEPIHVSQTIEMKNKRKSPFADIIEMLNNIDDYYDDL